MRRALVVLCLLMSLIAASQAHAVTSHMRFTVSSQVFSQCTGEVVDVELTVHVLERLHTDPQGITHRGATIFSVFSGTSASGARYTGMSHRTEEIRIDENVDMTLTGTGHIIINRLGEDGTADDLNTRFLVHFTRKANGELVVEKIVLDEACH